MKKILTLLLLPLLFACSNEVDNEHNPEDDFNIESIVGTVWEGTAEGRSARLEFYSDNTCYYRYDIINDANHRLPFDNYTYEYPKVYLNYYMECTISGNTITIVNTDGDRELLVAKLTYNPKLQPIEY